MATDLSLVWADIRPSNGIPDSTTLTELRGGSAPIFDYQILNIGDQEAVHSALNVVLSKDEIVSADDVLVGSTAINNYAPGAGSERTLQLDIPNSLSDGDYFIIGHADATGLITEDRESNNFSTPISVGYTSSLNRPDLVSFDFEVSKSELFPDDLFNFSYWLGNQGVNTAQGTTTGLYLSSDADVTQDDRLLATFSTNAIDGGETRLEEEFFRIPDELTSGSYFLRLFVDEAKVVGEIGGPNNFSNIVEISVKYPDSEDDPQVNDGFIFPVNNGYVTPLAGDGDGWFEAWITAGEETSNFSKFDVGYVLPLFDSHLGADFNIDTGNDAGEHVVAAFDGVVVHAGEVEGTHGGSVVIEHEVNGFKFSTFYSHVDNFSVDLLTASKENPIEINKGEKIAEIADLDISYGITDFTDHLHFAIFDGHSVSPREYSNYGGRAIEYRGVQAVQTANGKISYDPYDFYEKFKDGFSPAEVGGGAPVTDPITPTQEIIVSAANTSMISTGTSETETLTSDEALARMLGGIGTDVFEFKEQQKTSVVYDFEDGIDLLHIDFAGSDEMEISTYRGNDTLIEVRDNDIILRNVDYREIDISDFIPNDEEGFS